MIFFSSGKKDSSDNDKDSSVTDFFDEKKWQSNSRLLMTNVLEDILWILVGTSNIQKFVICSGYIQTNCIKFY